MRAKGLSALAALRTPDAPPPPAQPAQPAPVTEDEDVAYLQAHPWARALAEGLADGSNVIGALPAWLEPPCFTNHGDDPIPSYVSSEPERGLVIWFERRVLDRGTRFRAPAWGVEIRAEFRSVEGWEFDAAAWDTAGWIRHQGSTSGEVDWIEGEKGPR